MFLTSRVFCFIFIQFTGYIIIIFTEILHNTFFLGYENLTTYVVYFTRFFTRAGGRYAGPVFLREPIRPLSVVNTSYYTSTDNDIFSLYPALVCEYSLDSSPAKIIHVCLDFSHTSTSEHL